MKKSPREDCFEKEPFRISGNNIHTHTHTHTEREQQQQTTNRFNSRFDRAEHIISELEGKSEKATQRTNRERVSNFGETQ